MTKPMTLADAFALGRSHGAELAGNILADAPAIDADDFWDWLADAADGMRQYSPFEFYAAAINARPGDFGADEGWAKYEAGFDKGAMTALKRRGRYDVAYPDA